MSREGRFRGPLLCPRMNSETGRHVRRHGDDAMAPSRPMKTTSASAPESISASSAPGRGVLQLSRRPRALTLGRRRWRTCRVQHPLTDISTALDNGQRSPFGGTEWPALILNPSGAGKVLVGVPGSLVGY